MGGQLPIRTRRKGGSNPLLDAPDWELARMRQEDAAKRPAWWDHPERLPKRPPTKREPR